MWGRVENGSDVHRLSRAEGKATAPARSGTSASHGCRHHKWLDPQSRAAIVRLTGREADVVLYTAHPAADGVIVWQRLEQMRRVRVSRRPTNDLLRRLHALLKACQQIHCEPSTVFGW